jgi:hypothetical protein
MGELPVAVPRAMFRGYWAGGKRSRRVSRLHIIREISPAGWEPAKFALCGIQAASLCS